MNNDKKSWLKRSYFPGMISLIGLPLICIWYFFHIDQFTKFSAMSGFWGNDTFFEFYNARTGYNINLKDFNGYPNFTITGNSNDNIKVLAAVESLCQKMVRNKNYGNGVVVNFNTNSKYQDMVDVLDLGYCMADITYIPYGDKIYFTFPKPSKLAESASVDFCGTSAFLDGLKTSDEPQALYTYGTRGINAGIGYAKDFWPSILSFCLMIFFAFKKKPAV